MTLDWEAIRMDYDNLLARYGEAVRQAWNAGLMVSEIGAKVFNPRHDHTNPYRVRAILHFYGVEGAEFLRKPANRRLPVLEAKPLPVYKPALSHREHWLFRGLFPPDEP